MSHRPRYGAKPVRRIACLTLLAAASNQVACRSADPTPANAGPGAPIDSARQPVWVNGDFEDTAPGQVPNGWTLTTYRNDLGGVTGTAVAPPTTFAGLNLNTAGGGIAVSAVIGGAPESQTDPSLGDAGTLRLPKYGQRAMRVNETNYGYNANGLSQTMIASLGDVDPLDDKVHVRFAVAPVLNNPNHGHNQQPYYFVQLRNITRNTTLYTDFNVSGQPGVPWKTVGASLLYTDWQLVDIAPGNASLAVGDEVQLTVVAANCAQGGATHFARLYVDAVGSGVPGLYSWATGPQSANSGDAITYRVNYKNGGTTSTSGTKVELVTPPNTVFESISGGTCTTPTVGAAGTVSCTVGALSPGGTGSFLATVRVNPGTTGLITNGNYSISADGVSALIGPKVITSLTAGVQYADVGVTMSDGNAALGWGQPTSYTAVVQNHGAINAPSVTVTNNIPAQLTGASWTCTASAGSSCGLANGVGSISNTGSLLAGGTLTYRIDATAIAGTGSSSIVNTMNVAVAGGVVDPDSTNNAAVDTNAVGTLRTLTLAKVGLPTSGSVNTTPSAIACGTACSGANAQFLEGSQVVLTAAPAAGATFAGWGGACSGNATTCTVTIGADTSISATFAGSPASVAVSAGGGQTTTVGTAFAAPLAARVTDVAGIPVPGAAVSFAAPAGGATATLAGASALTNAAGIASLGATASTIAGSYAATASVSGVGSPATFALRNVPGAAASLQITSAQSQSARVSTAFAESLEVTLADSYGNFVPDTAVSFTAPSSGATAVLSATSATSNALGKASVSATAGTVAGLYAVEAQTAGVSPISFGLTNTAGDPATLHLVSGASQNTTVFQPFANPLVVRVEDAHGNVVPAASVGFSSPAAGASAQLSAGATLTNASGLASVSATANTKAGSYAIVAQVGGGQAPVSIPMRNDAASAHAIVASPLSAQQSAAADMRFLHALEATVFDKYENPVAGAAVHFSVPSTGSTAVLDASSANTDADGRVAIGAVAGTAMGSFTAEARVGGVELPASFSLSVLSAAPSELIASAGNEQSATVLESYAQMLKVRVVDRHGNPVAGVAVDTQLPAVGASASLPPGPYVTNANGEVELPLTANGVAGAYQLVASIEEGAAPVTFTLHNLPGAAASVLASLPTGAQSAVVSSAFAAPLTVKVQDAQGNPVPGKLVHFSAPSEGATALLSDTHASTDADGNASVYATASELTGRYQVLASLDGLDAPASFELANLADAPAHLTLVSGGAQQTRATTAFPQPLVVQLSDSHHNPVPSFELTVALPAYGSSVSMPLTARTGEDGIASFAMAANAMPGALQLAITADGNLAPLPVDLLILAIETSVHPELASNVVIAGDALALGVSVQSELGAPTGEIAVMHGLRTLTTVQLTDGRADLPLLFAEPGQHDLSVVYAAHGAYAASRSATFRVTVESKPEIDDDQHSSSSSGGSSSSSGTSGASSSSGDAPVPAADNTDATDAFDSLGGGSGCSVGTSSGQGLSSLALGLAALLVARRRQRRLQNR